MSSQQNTESDAHKEDEKLIDFMYEDIAGLDTILHNYQCMLSEESFPGEDRERQLGLAGQIRQRLAVLLAREAREAVFEDEEIEVMKAAVRAVAQLLSKVEVR